MSRHHMLPPIVYTPAPPKPKETRRRRGVGTFQGTGDVDETEETSEAAHTGPARGAAVQPRNALPIEAAERRQHPTTGNLSEETLKAMLELQEQEGGPDAGGAVPTTK